MGNKVGYETILVELARSYRGSEEAARENETSCIKSRKTSWHKILGARRPTRADEHSANVTGPWCWVVEGLNSFWQDVDVEYGKENDECGGLATSGKRFGGIEPKHVVPHDGLNLRGLE
ncbi:hypothetical protein GN958_ATG13327, partial [Phytophthora infestans]